MKSPLESLALGDVVTFKTGRLNSNAATPRGRYPFFTCSQETLRTDTYSFDTEAVLLAGNNANGIYPLKYFTGRFDAYQRTYVIRSKDTSKLDNRYLYYALEPQLELLKSISTGAATKFLTLTILKDIQIHGRPIQEQRRIASILSAYDDLIENNTRRIKILEEMAQRIYREWFVHFRFPGHENVKMVESELGPIPEGWSAQTVGTASLNFDSKRKPLSSIERAKRPGPYPYYGAARIFDYIDDYIFDGRYLLFAEDGTVITKDRRPVLQLTNGKFWPNNHTHVLKGRPPISTNFLYLAMLEVDISGYITGAAQPKVTQRNLNRIPILVPSKKLIERFDSICSALMDQIAVLEKKQDILRSTRDLLLPKLISGEVSVEGPKETVLEAVG